jgi:hypothetical protein
MKNKEIKTIEEKKQDCEFKRAFHLKYRENHHQKRVVRIVKVQQNTIEGDKTLNFVVSMQNWLNTLLSNPE